MSDLSLAQLMETLSERLATKLAREPFRIYARILTIEQAAVYLGLQPAELEQLVSSGELASVRYQQCLRLDRFDLDNWIEEHKAGWANLSKRSYGR